MRQSNRRNNDDPEPKAHEPRLTNRQTQPHHPPADRPARISNRPTTQPRKTGTRTPRVSNRQPTPANATPPTPITLKVSDGPATRRIRNANIYTVGQNINIRCEVLTGKPADIVCTVAHTDTGKHTDIDVDQQTGRAKHTPTRPGQHRYTFSAKNSDGNVQATASGIFIATDT